MATKTKLSPTDPEIRKQLTVQDNHRVIVEPEQPYSVRYGPDAKPAIRAKDWKDACDIVLSGIERHVDGVDRAYMESETVCKYCGSGWEVEKTFKDPDCPYGQPLCCNDAIDDWKELTSPTPETNHE